EDEEGGLESVFSIVPAREHPPTNAEHHRPVPVDEFRERAIVAVEPETAEEFGVGRVCVRRRADECQKAAGAESHDEIRWEAGYPRYYCRPRPGAYAIFTSSRPSTRACPGRGQRGR